MLFPFFFLQEKEEEEEEEEKRGCAAAAAAALVAINGFADQVLNKPVLLPICQLMHCSYCVSKRKAIGYLKEEEEEVRHAITDEDH